MKCEMTYSSDADKQFRSRLPPHNVRGNEMRVRKAIYANEQPKSKRNACVLSETQRNTAKTDLKERNEKI